VKSFLIGISTMQLPRLFFATALAAAAGFSIHVLYGRGWAEMYAQLAAQSGRMSHVLTEPYPGWIVAVAFTTGLVPTFGKVLVYLLVRERLPGRTAWKKGLWFGALLSLMSNDTLRQPLMDVLVGVPGDVAVAQALEPWLIQPLMGLLIALVLEFRGGFVTSRSQTKGN
jgi:hypothetical protein